MGCATDSRTQRSWIASGERVETMPAWKSAVIIECWPDRERTVWLCSDDNWHYYVERDRGGRILAKHRNG